MKTLVIHPQDSSTDIFKLIYVNKEYDIINDPFIDRTELQQQILNHDRIIILGDGTPSGLINPIYYDFTTRASNINPLIIDSSFVDYFKQKEVISVWCNSDKFFKQFGINGFHTGTLILKCSEQYCTLGKLYLNSSELFDNILNLSKIIGQCIEESADEMKEYILNHYTYDDPVTRFNRQNIIVL